MHCMVASSIPCKLSLCADRAHACAGDSHVSSAIDVACPTTQSVLAIASPHELHGDSWPSSSTGTSSFCCNHQYSVTAITTSAGSIAERYAYSAYGQPTILDASASVLSSSAINNRYTYTGREWDATLGLHHLRARWMSPSAGRFLTRDPIGFKGGHSLLYGYVAAQVLNAVDPSGLEKLQPVSPRVFPVGPGVGGACRLVVSRTCIYITVFVTAEQCGEVAAHYTTVPICVKTVEWICDEYSPGPEPVPPVGPPKDPDKKNPCTAKGWPECGGSILSANRLEACRLCNPGIAGIQPSDGSLVRNPWDDFIDEFPQHHYSCKAKKQNNTSIVCGFCCKVVGEFAVPVEGCRCAPK